MYAGPGSCMGNDLICFPTIWHKSPLDENFVSFILVCAHISSFLAWLFRFLCCCRLQLCSVCDVLQQSTDWLVISFPN